MTTQITTLPPAERAAVALDFDVVKAEAIKLASQWADITSISNKAGRDQVHAAAMTLKNKCTEIKAAAKLAREDAVAYQKAVIAKGDELVGILEPERDRLLGVRDEWDAEREAEKAAAAEAEAKRKERHEASIRTIRSYPDACVGHAASRIASMIELLVDVETSECRFEEYAPVATRAKSETLARLEEMAAAARAAEAEQARIKAAQEAEAARLAAEREELARLRAEAAERQRIADEQAAEARRIEEAKLAEERAEMEKALAEQRAQAAAERNRMEDEQEAFRAQQAEFNRQKEELQRIEDERAAEAKRQQDEIEWAKAAAAKAAADILAAEKAEADRVEQARIQAAAEAARQAEELAERLKREANAPQSGEIVTLIADHYRISNGAALDWLRVMFGDVRVAA